MQAQANLVAFLDADDEWTATFLETILHLRPRFPEAKVFGTSYVYAYEDGHWRLPRLRGAGGRTVGRDSGRLFPGGRDLRPAAVVFGGSRHESRIAEYSWLSGRGCFGEDLLTWARLAARYPVAYSMQRLSLYHMQEDGIPSMLRDGRTCAMWSERNSGSCWPG